MTCIAAAVDSDGTIYMGADAVCLQGGCVRMDRRSKVFRVGPFLIGASGSLRSAQIMEHTFEPPAVVGNLSAYMVKDFVPALRKHMKDQGGEIKQDDDKMIIDGRCVVGIDGHVFEVDQTYAVVQPCTPFYAIGCASQEAMAAMFTANRLLPRLSGEDVVHSGLLAAAEFDIKIRPPFSTVSLARNSE